MTWTEYIRDDLRQKIASGKDVPDRLTINFLSEHYEVSPTPVRLAINELVDEAYLIRKSNGRIELNPNKMGSGKGRPPRKLPKPPEDYYTRIADDLVERSFKGQKLELEPAAVAEDYGISQTMVRQIFNRLAGIGLLKHLPRRGWELVPFDRKLLDDFLQVREALELLALELAMPRMDRAELQRIYDNNYFDEETDSLRHDNSLHDYIIRCCDNHFVSNFMERYGQYYHILLNWETQDPESRRAVIKATQEHRYILEAILAGDLAESKRRLSLHIHNPDFHHMMSAGLRKTIKMR